MSDFLSELRREVVDAHERRHAAGRPRRALDALHPRAWRLAPVAGGIAVAAAALLAALAVRYLARPEPPPARPHVIRVVPLGGVPQDAVLGYGSLWVADFHGRVVRVDPRTGGARSSIPLAGTPMAIAAGGGAVWVRTEDASPYRTHLTRIDPARRRIVARIPAGTGTGIAAGAGAVWLLRGHPQSKDVFRIDPASGATTVVHTPVGGSGLAASGDRLWSITLDGTVAEIDAHSGRTVGRWPALEPAGPSDSLENSLAADPSGLWILGQANGEIVRIEGGRVVRRIPIGTSVLPVLAQTPGALWTATREAGGARYRVWRIDPDSGEVVGTVGVGPHRPVTLVATGDRVAVVAIDGTLLFVGP